jgi:hypothetical protein
MIGEDGVAAVVFTLCTLQPARDRGRSGQASGQGWAGKSVEIVGKPLIFGCDLRKLCEEWNL